MINFMTSFRFFLLSMAIFLVALLVAACADFETEKSETCTVEQQLAGVLMSCPDGSNSFIPNGTQGEKGEDGKDLTSTESKMGLAGYYLLPYGGSTDIVKDGTGLYDVNPLVINTKNPNDTICSLSLPRSNVALIGSKISYGAGVNLAANNCRSDSGDALRTRSGTTYAYNLVIDLNDNDRLRIRLLILQKKNGTTTLVINRTITEE